MSFLSRLVAAIKTTTTWVGFDLQRGDGALAQTVVLVDPTTGDAYSAEASAASGRVAVTTVHIVTTAFVGANLGDVLTHTQIVDTSEGTPVTVVSVWRNQTLNADLASAPLPGNISVVGARSLSDAELRASPVNVEVSSSVEVEVKNDAGNPVGVVSSSLTYIDRTVAALSTGQAAGSSAVLNLNADRRALLISAPANCTLTLDAASSMGIPVVANTLTVLSGNACPNNGLFVRGLGAGATLVIWEA